MSDGARGLRVAFIGKGGAGKSTLAGTTCRFLARSGHRILALDVDTLPGLGLSLGYRNGVPRLPDGLARRVEGKGWQVVEGFRPAELVDRYSGEAPDGIRYLELGKLPGGVKPAVTMAFRQVMDRFRRRGWTMIADLAAGTRQPYAGWAGFADIKVIVSDPSAKGLLTARRLAAVGTHVVATKVRADGDAEHVEATVGLPLLGVIPYDEELAEAERQGLAPFDVVPHARAVRAVSEVAVRLAELAGEKH